MHNLRTGKWENITIFYLNESRGATNEDFVMKLEEQLKSFKHSIFTQSLHRFRVRQTRDQFCKRK